MKKRAQLVWDNLIPWIIGLGVLVLGFLIYLILNGKLGESANFINKLFKLGK